MDSLIVLGTENLVLTCPVFIRERNVLCNNFGFKNKENIPFKLLLFGLKALPVPTSWRTDFSIL